MNIILKSFVAGLTLASTCAVAAAYEPPVGSRLGNRLKPLANSSANMTRIASRAAECTAAKHTSAARAVLDAMDKDALGKALLPLQHMEYCQFRSFLDTTVEAVNIRTDDDIYRGMLAEGLLKDSGRDKGLTPLPLEAAYERPWFVMTGREPVIDEMATCIAAIDPQDIRRIFKTVYDSKEERQAFGLLGPALGQCLQAGVQLKANALSLRTALAEALYHRAYDPASTASAAQSGAGQ